MRPARGIPSLLAVLATAGLAALGPAAAPLGAAEVMLAVADGRGAAVESLSVDDLSLALDGEPAVVEGVERLAGPWRIVLLFDRTLARERTLRNAAVELSARAAALTEAGEVEIWVADGEVRQSLPPTRDPVAVESGLAWMGVRERARDAQRSLRRAFLADLAGGGISVAAAIEEIGPSLRELTRATEAAKAALGEEARLLGAHGRALVSWAAQLERPEGRPVLVLLVSDGADDDPTPFYRRALAEAGHPQVAESLEARRPRPDAERVGAALAALDLLVVPYRPPTESDLLLAGEELPGEPREAPEGLGDLAEAPGEDLEPGVESSRVGVDLLDLRRRRGGEEAAQSDPLSRPESTLRALASATGGRLVRDGRGIERVLAGLTWRWRVTYRAESVAAGEVARLEVAGHRPGWSFEAPAWQAEGPPPLVSELRVLDLLAGEEPEGEEALPVGAAIRLGGADAPGAMAGGSLAALAATGIGDGELLVQIVEEAAGLGALRASVAVAWGEAEPAVFHRPLATPAEPEGVGWSEDEDGSLLYRLPLPLPGGSGSRVAVVVEELGTGRRGAALAALVEGGAADVAGDESLLLPAPRAIHLMAPSEVLAVGATSFRSIVSDRGVARVRYLLDGEAVAESAAAPFAVDIDLGPLPRAREVEAVALAADGSEVGRDRLVVNEGAGSLRVRIVEPSAERLRGEGLLVGPVDVEAEVKVPRFTEVERVEFYWNAELVATRFGPPYRQRVVVPEESPQGFVRVVVRLADGSAGEDVVFLNSPGSIERLQVELVELYVVVTDRDGRPVRGLGRDDFRIEEEGVEQEIATFAEAGDLPLTVGLTIDTSASMFVKLPRVQRAAAEFVLGFLDRRDRAFVVAFGNEPRLSEDTTSRPVRLVDAIGGLVPEGGTAVWEAIVYSLVQLQGVPGRKALVVYSDGADEDDEFPYRTCLRFARRLGVPIYVIVTNSEIYRTGGGSLAIRSYLGRLERLVDAVGGRVYLTRVGEDLAGIYREIGEELRSQYLVAYYPRGSRDEEFRDVDVKVVPPGLEVRTISGYYR